MHTKKPSVGQVWQNLDSLMPSPYAKITELHGDVVTAVPCFNEHGDFANGAPLEIPLRHMQGPFGPWQLGWILVESDDLK